MQFLSHTPFQVLSRHMWLVVNVLQHAEIEYSRHHGNFDNAEKQSGKFSQFR